MTAPKEEIERFLKTTRLSNYQHIPLPYGLEIPGKDHRKKLEAVFPDSLAGKSVLDVGCYYGLYAHEAARRGADRVVGVERDPERFAAAQEIARLIGDGVQIIQGDITTLDLNARFDLVIFLSVLHHIRDPLAVMRRLASLCTDTLIVEFCTPSHRLRRKWQPQREELAGLGKIRRQLQDYYRRGLLQLLGEQAGIIVTGDVFGAGDHEFDWTFFFNQKSFRTVFQIQQGLFSEVRFVPSPQKRNRMLAFCTVPAG